MKKRTRIILAVMLVAITIVAFVHYLTTHRDLITKLSQTPLSTVLLLLFLYMFWFIALAITILATLRLCKKSLGVKENFLLNGYSTLVNFFVPGQGGVAVRGIYLKKTKKLAIRDYIFASLLYYMFYAVISAVLVLFDSRPFWQTATVTIFVAAISFALIYLYKKRAEVRASELALNWSNLSLLLLATLFQAIVQVAIFSVELHSVNPHVALHQTVIYTGVANFSLFVALTPGAIGIRESFLLFTRKLSGITSANIIAANVIDRAVFIVFLGLLFILTISFHAKYRSLFSQPSSVETEDQPQSSAN